jgi:hypothetical protein
MARIRKRMDVVVGGVTSIADPDERWEALQALERGDGAAEAMLAATPPEERRMIDAVVATSRSARSESADDLVAALVAAHGGDGVDGAGPVAFAGVPLDPVAPPFPREEAALAVAGLVDGAEPLDEDEEARRSLKRAKRRRRAILSRRMDGSGRDGR